MTRYELNSLGLFFFFFFIAQISRLYFSAFKIWSPRLRAAGGVTLEEEREAMQDKTEIIWFIQHAFFCCILGELLHLLSYPGASIFIMLLLLPSCQYQFFQLRSSAVFSACTVWYHQIWVTFQIFALFYFILNCKIKLFPISPCTSVWNENGKCCKAWETL